MTSLEGRVIRRRKAIDPPAGVRSELWVWSELARRLGSPGTFATDPAVVFDELARASAGGRADYSGLSHERLDAEDGLFWPCPAGDGAAHPGTPRLFTESFPTPDGRARPCPWTTAARVTTCGPRPPSTWSPAGSCSTTSRGHRPEGSPSWRPPCRSRTPRSTPSWPTGWASPRARRWS